MKKKDNKFFKLVIASVFQKLVPCNCLSTCDLFIVYGQTSQTMHSMRVCGLKFASDSRIKKRFEFLTVRKLII